MNIKEIGDVFHCDCGFSWSRGKNGNHNCANGLREKVRQLAAENVALKKFCKNAAFDADYEAELGMERGGFTDALNNIETPSTDRIVAGIKADGVEEWVSSRGGRWNGTTEEALKFAKQLREGKSEEVKS